LDVKASTASAASIAGSIVGSYRSDHLLLRVTENALPPARVPVIVHFVVASPLPHLSNVLS
jgi:hypothetical protein